MSLQSSEPLLVNEPEDREWLYSVQEINVKRNGTEAKKKYNFKYDMTLDANQSSKWSPGKLYVRMYDSDDPNDFRYQFGDKFYLRLLGPIRNGIDTDTGEKIEQHGEATRT